MPYESLEKIFYKYPKQYEEMYQKRLSSESTYKLPIVISNFPAFYVSSPELFRVNDELHTVSRQLLALVEHQNVKVAFKDIYSKDYSKNLFLRRCLIEELVLTNGIEGIKSSREEMMEAIQASEDTKVRFQGLAKKYMMLISNTELDFMSCSGIRKLYDDIIINEIKDEKDIPDGEFFRKDIVAVIDGIKSVHKGLYPERKIIEAMEAGFAILNDSMIPMIVRIAIFHYLIGYIHPFYDGNGRLSRYISSYFLGKYFDPFVALKLSYVIKKEKKRYFKAFEEANNFKNRGDLTLFVKTFVGFILDAYNELIDFFHSSIQQISYYLDVINKIHSNICQTNSELIILIILVQAYCFGDNRISIEDLKEATGINEVTTRNALKSFNAKGIVEVNKLGKKHLYSLNVNKIDELYNNHK